MKNLKQVNKHAKKRVLTYSKTQRGTTRKNKGTAMGATKEQLGDNNRNSNKNNNRNSNKNNNGNNNKNNNGNNNKNNNENNNGNSNGNSKRTTAGTSRAQ